MKLLTFFAILLLSNCLGAFASGCLGAGCFSNKKPKSKTNSKSKTKPQPEPELEPQQKPEPGLKLDPYEEEDPLRHYRFTDYGELKRTGQAPTVAFGGATAVKRHSPPGTPKLEIETADPSSEDVDRFMDIEGVTGARQAQAISSEGPATLKRRPPTPPVRKSPFSPEYAAQWTLQRRKPKHN